MTTDWYHHPWVSWTTNLFYGFTVGQQKMHHLPIEILSEIASYLPYSDVVSLRQTSKKLREAVDAHVVWLNLAREYSSRHLYHPTTGTQPLHILSTSRVRQWIEKRLMIDEIWRKPLIRPRSRILPSFLNSPLVAKIVPGGRWLLAGDKRGSIYSYDLDLDDPQPVLLIGPDSQNRIPGDAQTILAIDFAVEPGYPSSEFTLAFVGDEYSGSRRSLQWIHIWRIRLEADDTLKAHRLMSLPCRNSLGCSKLSFSADLVARPTIVASQFWIDTYWWNECNATHVVKCAFPVRPLLNAVYVIGKDRLLCITRGHELQIYDLEPECIELATIGDPRPDLAPHRPSWSHSLDGRGSISCSRLYFDGTNYRQVISTVRGIMGLIIPRSREESPTIIKLSEFNQFPLVYGLGLHKGFLMLGVDNTNRFGWSWDSDQCAYSNGNITINERTRCPSSDFFTFDEELGRLGCIGRKGILVLDFPLPSV